MPALLSGMGDYLATVHVKFHDLVYDVDDPSETPAQGYYRTFGIRSSPTRVRDVLIAAVEDGVIDWSESEYHSVDPASLDRGILKHITPVSSEGIWYLSGRLIYADPELLPEPN